MSVVYVLVRNDGMFVTPPGEKHSYTKYLQNARQFPTREDAERERCVGNEYVAPMEKAGR